MSSNLLFMPMAHPAAQFGDGASSISYTNVALPSRSPRLDVKSTEEANGEDDRDDADADADDENGDEEDDTAPEDEEDEEEEEPRLKYMRLGNSVPTLLSADAASCITVAERIIALGTHDGTVHLLDYQGNQVKEFRPHTATVNELSFDAAGEYIGSCSDDGSVVVNSLYTEEIEKFEYHRPMKAVALDPDYAQKSSRRFATGGLAGQLILNTKGWLGYRDQVLHSGEGPVHAVKWRTSLIAWANDGGVKIYDTASYQRLAFIERPKGSPRAELLRPHLVWQDDTILLIGWGNHIKIAAMRTRGSDLHKDKARAINGKASWIPGTKYVEIVVDLQTEYYICGLAPYGEALVVLAYISDKEKEQNELVNPYSPSQGHAQRPEVCILTWQKEELATDALSIHGYEHYKAKDYVLAHAPFSGSSSAGGQWAAGDEPLYYIVSPKDVVIARPRDADDHISWLLDHGRHEKALAAVEAGNARTELIDEVGSRYLDHLILQRQYAQAAELCPKLLRGSAVAWERWVFNFTQLRQLPALAPYIPTTNPQLRDTIYEMVLNALVTNPANHEQLLATVRSWPPTIYSVPTVITAIELQLNSISWSSILSEALAELYVMQNNYEKALSIYLELGKDGVFDFIERHNLYNCLHGKVLPLLKLDGKRAVTLLLQQSSNVSVAEVVEELQKAGQNETYRYLLHLYLHSLFEKDPQFGKEFHGLQVELYAEYEPRLLLPFLRSSDYYSLDKAYEVCTRRALTKEQVFILGRMGNSREALALIVKKLRDMQEAIDFVKTQHDEELWEELINQCLHDPDMIGFLLEHTDGHIDPLHLVNKIPFGMHISHLRDRLVKIITDYGMEASLRERCNECLKADCVNLQAKKSGVARHGIHVGGKEATNKVAGAGSAQTITLPGSGDVLSQKQKNGQGLSDMSGSGRCCICLDPLDLHDVGVVTFFCTHVYHSTCLNDTSHPKPEKIQHIADYSKNRSFLSVPNGGSHDDEDDDDNEGTSSKIKIRCILCTTAAATSNGSMKVWDK